MNSKTFSFAPIFYLFFSRTKVTVTKRDVTVSRPRFFASLIPTGRSTGSMPLRNISDVSIHHNTALLRMLAGILITVFSVKTMFGGAEGAGFLFLLAVCGLVISASAVQKTLVICSGREAIRINAPWYANRTLEKINRAINESMCYEADKVDLFQFQERMAAMQQAAPASKRMFA